MAIYAKKDSGYAFLKEIRHHVGLAKGTGKGHRALPERGKERALKAARHFRSIARKRKIRQDKIYAVLTAATRNVKDTRSGGKFIRACRKILPFRVIGGKPEARFGAKGVLSKVPDAHGVVGGIGGGSFQLTLLKEGKIKKTASISEGILTLLEESHKDPDTIRKILEPQVEKVDFQGVENFYVTGSNWKVVAKLLTSRIQHKKIQNVRIHKTKLEWAAVSDELLALAHENTNYFKGKNMTREVRERASEIAAGAMSLWVVLNHVNPQNIIIPDTNMRDGIAYLGRKDPVFRNHARGMTQRPSRSARSKPARRVSVREPDGQRDRAASRLRPAA
jgi:exopolyphosphatase/guanosine-5'-triphosphate,3'-diphosphate pyrophosphatase